AIVRTPTGFFVAFRFATPFAGVHLAYFDDAGPSSNVTYAGTYTSDPALTVFTDAGAARVLVAVHEPAGAGGGMVVVASGQAGAPGLFLPQVILGAAQTAVPVTPVVVPRLRGAAVIAAIQVNGEDKLAIYGVDATGMVVATERHALGFRPGRLRGALRGS